MFLDESGDHNLKEIDNQYPIFVLAGVIVDFDDYNDKFRSKINELKIKYFGVENIILRSYDIRKQKGQFSSLVDLKKRNQFYEDINSLIKELDFKIIAAGIHKTELKNKYSQPDNPYHLCFRFILERSVMFLGKTKEQMIMRMESRETHNDQQVAKVFEHFRSKGNQMFSTDEIQGKLVDLSFNQKMQNIVGHQVADLVAYPIGRWILDKQKENKPFEIVKKKFHNKNGKVLNFGLKIFP